VNHRFFFFKTSLLRLKSTFLDAQVPATPKAAPAENHGLTGHLPGQDFVLVL
jgi:hypothetical protein